MYLFEPGIFECTMFEKFLRKKKKIRASSKNKTNEFVCKLVCARTHQIYTDVFQILELYKK